MLLSGPGVSSHRDSDLYTPRHRSSLQFHPFNSLVDDFISPHLKICSGTGAEQSRHPDERSSMQAFRRIWRFPS